MKDFLGEVELTIEQAENVARAMYRLAAAEHGVHENEKAMIDSFYLACCEEAGVEPVDLGQGDWDAEQAKSVLSTPDLRDTLVRSCFLVGYADGECSEAERAEIVKIAREASVSEERVVEINFEVKKVLLSQFQDIKVFKEAAYDIGKQLGMSSSEVDDVLAGT